MQFGTPNDASDWVYVDNLCHAIILAQSRMDKVRGNAFFIGDGEPCNTIDMSAPLWTMVSGQTPGNLWIPFRLIYWVAFIFEMLRIPLLSRAETCKVAVTHWWGRERVQRLLHYHPIVSRQEGLARMYQDLEIQTMQQGYPMRYQRFRARMWMGSLFLMLMIIYLAIF